METLALRAHVLTSTLTSTHVSTHVCITVYHTVIETWVEVRVEVRTWARKASVSTLFLPNLHECFYNVWEHGENVFYFFYGKQKRGKTMPSKVLDAWNVRLKFTFSMGSTPTFLYSDLYLNTAYAAQYVYKYSVLTMPLSNNVFIHFLHLFFSLEQTFIYEPRRIVMAFHQWLRLDSYYLLHSVYMERMFGGTFFVPCRESAECRFSGAILCWLCKSSRVKLFLD